MPWELSKPSKGGGGGLQKADHVDHLFIAIDPTAEEMDSVHGRDWVARCRYYVCLGCGGKVMEDQLVWGKVIVPALTEEGKAVVVGILATGTTRTGNQFYSVEEPTEADMVKASEWMDANARTYGQDIPTPADHPELEGRIALDLSF